MKAYVTTVLALLTLQCGLGSSLNATERSSCRCGQKGRASRIVNGEEAGPGEFPWQAGMVVVFPGNLLATAPSCGGTILTAKTVLTAAHCFYDHKNHVRSTYDWAVMYGTNYLKPAHNRIEHVASVHVHPHYDDASIRNDITVVVLRNALPLGPTVSPACLPSARTNYIGAQALVSGWGNTKHRGDQPDYLQKLEMSVLTNRSCRRKWGNWYVSGKMICANRAFSSGTCQGDSGGPLVASDGVNYNVIGVVSYGATDNCITASVFTKVQAYLSFIEGVLATAHGDTTCPR